MIAVQPPTYFPGLPYLALMERVTVFILADTFQYSRQSFQNRAKVRTPQGWQWVTVPLKGRQHGRTIREVEVDNRKDWAAKHRRALQYNYRRAPFFEYYEAALEEVFGTTWPTLGPLTCRTVILLHRLYGLDSTVRLASDLPGAPDTLTGILAHFPDERLVVPVSTAVHDAHSVPGLSIFQYNAESYHQNFDGFVERLSGLDLLFNYGFETRGRLRSGIQPLFRRENTNPT